MRYRGLPRLEIPYLGLQGEELAVRYREALCGPHRFRWKTGTRSKGLLYGIERWDEFKRERKHGWVLIVEGESDCWACWHHGLPALGIPGKKNVPDRLPSELDGLELVVWQEPKAEDFPQRVAAAAGRAVLAISHPDYKDPCEAHERGEDLQALIEALRREGRKVEPPPRKKDDLGFRAIEDPERGIGLYERRETAAGVVENRLTAFVAKITVEYYDLEGGPRWFGLDATLCDGSKTSVSLPAQEFENGKWLAQRFGSKGIPIAIHRQRILTAIQAVSEDTRKVAVVRATGWHVIDGRRVFIHASGAIASKEPTTRIQISLPAPLTRFALPEPPSREELQATATDIVFWLERVARTPSVLAPGLAAVFRAPLGPFDGAIFYYGPTDVGKSTLASLLQNFYAESRGHADLPMSWSSTANAIETAAHFAKDVLLVVDDLAPAASPQDRDRKFDLAERVFRGTGNLSGRARLNRDCSLQAQRQARGVILATGEILPRGHSIRARLFSVEVAKDDVKRDALTEGPKPGLEGWREKLKRLMAGYLLWLAERKQDSAPVYSHSDPHAGLLRTAHLGAELCRGIETCAEYLEHLGLEPTFVKKHFRERYLAGLAEVEAAQRETADEEHQGKLFLQALRDVLRMDAARLEDKGIMPRAHLGHQGPTIGVCCLRDGTPIALIFPGPALAAIRQARLDDGLHGISPHRLGRLLYDLGALMVDPERQKRQKRFTIQKKFGPETVEGLPILEAHLWPEKKDERLPEEHLWPEEKDDAQIPQGT